MKVSLTPRQVAIKKYVLLGLIPQRIATLKLSRAMEFTLSAEYENQVRVVNCGALASPGSVSLSMGR